jgi:hypothetical protein
VSEARDLAQHEREALLRVLEAASFTGASELRAQVPQTKVVVGNLPSFLDLEVESSARASPFREGPIPVRAFVEAPGGDYEGELMVWVTEGYLSGLEFAWVTDEMPTGMPPADVLKIQPE